MFVINFRDKCFFRSVSSRTGSRLSTTTHNCSPARQGLFWPIYICMTSFDHNLTQSMFINSTRVFDWLIWTNACSVLSDPVDVVLHLDILEVAGLSLIKVWLIMQLRVQVNLLLDFKGRGVKFEVTTRSGINFHTPIFWMAWRITTKLEVKVKVIYKVKYLSEHLVL